MALGARQQVKILKTGQLSRHYIAEISLNVTLNHNQPTTVSARRNHHTLLLLINGPFNIIFNVPGLCQFFAASHLGTVFVIAFETSVFPL